MKGRGAAPFETEALLLRSTPLGDADRLVVLFTLQRGKLAAVARHARSSRRRFGGTLEPFVRFRATLVPGAGELHALRAAEPLGAFVGLLGDLARVEAASGALRCLRELLPVEQPEPDLYADLLRLLTRVEHAGDPSGALRLAFTLHVLCVLGSAPRLDRCGSCDARAPEGRAGTFDPRQGALVCRSCGGAPLRLSWVLRGWLIGAAADWQTAAVEPPPPEDMAMARRALSAFLEAHVGAQAAAAVFPALA